MMSERIPVFECPACGQPVDGKADYIARGLKCPACGIGFIPVERKTRVREVRESAPTMVFAGAAGVVLMIVLLALVFGPVVGGGVIWLGVVVAVVGLLIGIFVRLGRMANLK
jgi:DNA-directed RNA polymerase subunit RPC12/RpoP